MEKENELLSAQEELAFRQQTHQTTVTALNNEIDELRAKVGGARNNNNKKKNKNEKERQKKRKTKKEKRKKEKEKQGNRLPVNCAFFQMCCLFDLFLFLLSFFVFLFIFFLLLSLSYFFLLLLLFR